jgi:hypothetical protein
MTQQVPLPPSKLRKGFLSVGIVLLIMGFFFFYCASRIDYDYVTQSINTVTLDSPISTYRYDFGEAREFYGAPSVLMHENDLLIVENNRSIRTVLWDVSYGTTEKVLTYSEHGSLAYFKNNQDWRQVRIYLTVPTTENLTSIQTKTVSVTTTLNHYERPHWILFGIGVVLSSLALVPIIKSKK